MSEDLRLQAHRALQQIRGLDPDAPPTEPIAQAAWALETNAGRRHPLDVIIRGSLHPALKSRGFERKDERGTGGVGGLVHVINLQASKYNVLDGAVSVSVYVNIGVFIPEVQELVDREPGDGFIPEYRCHIRHRLNQLTDDRSQLIMSLEPDRTLEQQGEQLTRWILDPGVTYLDSFSSLEALYAILRDEVDRGLGDARGWPFIYAVVKTGDRERAEAAGRQRALTSFARQVAWQNYAR